MKVKKKHLTGEIADFPKHIVQAMVDEQVRQGNKADPSVFENRVRAEKALGGFTWGETDLGFDIWTRVINNKCFYLIPKPEKHKGHAHAELMEKYANDAKTSATPWKLWECKYDGRSDWCELNNTPVWSETVQYRRKSENKESVAPNEIIKAMLDKGMPVWAGVSDVSYDAARDKLNTRIQRVLEYDDSEDYPVRLKNVGWKYAVPIDPTTMTEITEPAK